MDVVIFNSIQQTQISKMKDSGVIVFELIQKQNLYALDPYSMLSFLTNKMPAITNVAVFLGPEHLKR